MTRSLEGVLLILLGEGLNVKRGIREMGRVEDEESEWSVGYNVAGCVYLITWVC